MREVLEHIAQGVVKFDNSRRLEVWNSRYQEVLQFPQRFLRPGLPNRDMARFLAERGDFGDGDPDAIAAARLDLLWSGSARRLGITVKRQKVYEVLTEPTEDGGLVITYTDVTERERSHAKIAEQCAELQRLNQHKSILFSVVAHDLRSPFNLLLNAAELMSQLGDRLTPGMAVEYATAVGDAAGTVFGLLDNLLEWAQLEMNQTRGAPETLGLGAIVDDAIGTSAETARRKAMTVRNDITDLDITTDRHALGVVVRNLLGNAIKYSDPGGTVTIDARPDGGGGVELNVTDDGVGMTEIEVAALFRDGGVPSRSGTCRERGTGLGFLLCRQFVARLGGDIRVDSRPGRGTTVRVTLPGTADTPADPAVTQAAGS